MRIELTEDEIRTAIEFWMFARDGREVDGVSIAVRQRPHRGHGPDYRLGSDKFVATAVIEYQDDRRAIPKQVPGLGGTLARQPRAPVGGLVYFIGAADGSGHVKVGFTSGAASDRLAALQTGSPVLLCIIGTVGGTSDTEREFHQRLADYRHHGEWFDRSAALDLLAQVEPLL